MANPEEPNKIVRLLHDAAMAVVFYADIAALDTNATTGAQREAALAVWSAMTDSHDDEEALDLARMFARGEV